MSFIEIFSRDEAEEIMSTASSVSTVCLPLKKGGKNIFALIGIKNNEIIAVGYSNLCVGFVESKFVDSDLMDGLISYHSNKLNSSPKKAKTNS